jgi:V/A-type H+-transporting ATPase subunit E
MGIEEIKKKIIEDAREEKKRILAEARKKASQIVEEGKKSAEEQRKEIISRAQREAEMEKSRIITIENLESRKKVLSAKQEVIQKVFIRAMYMLSNLDDYQELMENLICAAAKGGEEIIISSEDKKRLNEDFFHRVNARLGDPLRISEETRNIAGGFVLRTGDIEINESFDEKIETLRDDMESQIAQIVFSGDNG